MATFSQCKYSNYKSFRQMTAVKQQNLLFCQEHFALEESCGVMELLLLQQDHTAIIEDLLGLGQT